MPAKKRPPAVKAIQMQILMSEFYILLLTYEIASCFSPKIIRLPNILSLFYIIHHLEFIF